MAVAVPLARVVNGGPRHSDHRPVILNTGSRGAQEWCRTMEAMRKFEARWLKEEECGDRVEEALAQSLEAGSVNLMEIQRKVL